MRETRKEDNTRAIIGTAIFHGVLLLCFFLFGLSTPLPLPEEQGVLVTLGYMDQGMGATQPLRAAPPVAQPQASPPASAPEQVVTQDTEEAVSLPEAPRVRPAEQARPEQPRPETPRQEPIQPPQETAEVTPQEPPQPQVDPRALFPGSDPRTTQQQNQGATQQPGAQGSPTGAVTGQGYAGAGQGGVDYSLSGRSHLQLPMPDYTTQAQGRVVVTIVVNRQGQVVRATAGARGTTTSDQTLWRLAEEAARRARFNVQTDAPEEQTGTITYNFIRQN